VRNNYFHFQPAMRQLMAPSVGVWESDLQAFSYQPIGYMQIRAELMHEDVRPSTSRSMKRCTTTWGGAALPLPTPTCED
jgi:hypothetical protein